MILSQGEVRDLLARTLSFCDADECDATLYMSSEANLRFANNVPTTNGMSRDTSLHVSCIFGKRVGRASTSQTDDASLKRVVEKATAIARLSPESPEHMPRVGPQSYS